MGHYKTEYPDGLGHDFWLKWVAPVVKELKGNKCEDCGESEKLLDLHHLDYKKEVTIHTLKLLCRKCHRKYHVHRNQYSKKTTQN